MVTVSDPGSAAGAGSTDSASTHGVVSAPEARGQQIGSTNTQVNFYGDSTVASGSVKWPVVVGTLPPATDQYQPRPELSAAVDDGRTVVLTTAVGVSGRVLSGLGGVGKTQLAADHARRQWHASRVDLLVWVPATSTTAIQAEYARAASRVGVAAEGTSDAARRFLEWLHTTDRRWLIVLDDLTDPHDLTSWWPPSRPTGHTVITTRRRDAMLDRQDLARVEVGLFTPAEATAYLTAKLRDAEALTEAVELAADLGWLPLALSHAATFIADYGLTCATYRTRLAHRRLADVTPTATELPDRDTRTITATWSLSIDAADRTRPYGVAQPLLELASLLDPNGIPFTLFTTPPVLEHLSRVTGRRITADDASDGLHSLSRYSLIAVPKTRQTHPVIRVHGLVQRVVREHIRPDHYERTARAAADALLHFAISAEHDSVTVVHAHTNVTILQQHAETVLWMPHGHDVLWRTGNMLGEIGQVATARSYFDRLADTAHRLLGSDHPRTLTARHDIARWQGHAGDAAGAVAALELLLADRLRILGPDHPDTLTTRLYVAFWQRAAGDPTSADATAEQLLPDMVRVLGPDHRITLDARHNIASWIGHAGDPDSAAAAFEQLLSDRLRVLGPDHSHTFTTRNNLAFWRGAAGDPAGALAAFNALFADRLRVLGPDHPHTLNTRHNIATWTGHAGDPATAAAGFQQLADDRLRVLGPDHPHTVATRRELTRWRSVAGLPHDNDDTAETQQGGAI